MTTTTLAPEDLTPFSQQLWSSTSSEHGSAETSGFMSDLVSGTLPVEGYIEMHRQLFFLYRTLEDAMDRNAHQEVIRAFFDERLRRTPALAKDLVALGGSEPADAEMTAATAGYCEQIERTADEWLPGLIAHHYTRYLGDLSGGQHIRRVVERTYGIDAASGSAFYHFEGIDDLVGFKKAYRVSLDSMTLTGQERERFIAEVIHSYRLSTELVTALG